MADSVVAGKVCVPPETKKTDGGKVCLRWAIMQKNQPVQCIAWSHMISDEMWPLLSSLPLGTEVVLKGFWGIRQAQRDIFSRPDEGGGEKEFVVKWVNVKGVANPQPQTSHVERITQLLGGPEEADRKWRERLVEMSEKGYAWAKTGEKSYGWRKRDECVKHKGVVKSRLEYLMDVLGSTLVMSEMKRVGLSYSFSDRKKYEALMAELMETAREFEKHPVGV